MAVLALDVDLAGLAEDLTADVEEPAETVVPVPLLLLAAVDVTVLPDVVAAELLRLNTGVAEPDPERVATAAEDLLDMLEDDVRTLVAAELLPMLPVRENPGLLCRPTVEAREP